jgi:hypothetical protein
LMPIMIFMTRYYNTSQHICRFDSVTNQLNKIISLTLFTLVTLFIVSCEENPTTIGTSMLPSSDFVVTKSIDTISARSYTVYEDSVRSDNPILSHIGTLYDPYFGTTTTGFVTQIRLGGAWEDLPVTVDSVKLFLRLLSVKGKPVNVLPTLKLLETSEQIYTDKEYYSSREVPLTGVELANVEIPSLKEDTINDVTIKLPASMGNYIIRDPTMLFYSNIKPDFRSYFKGIYFQMSAGADPLLVSLSVAPPSSIGYYNNTMVFYMHDTSTGTLKNFFFVLDAMNQNAAYNKIAHDFSTAEPDKKIQHINDGYRDTLSYIQSLNGVFTKITLPGLENIKNNPAYDKIAVNKARLTVPIHLDGDIYTLLTAPQQLLLRFKTASGVKYIVPDYSASPDFFDGTLDAKAKVYNFNLAGFVQAYLDDTKGEVLPELEMYQNSGTKNVILKANNSKSPVKFSLTYTKF